MALFHLSVTQTKRSAGQSAIASAAYRAGERLYSEYYGEYSDYTRKGGVICSDILLPSHAPPEYADRQTTLWNAVEKACPHSPGDWYFSGHYPTPGGNKRVNECLERCSVSRRSFLSH